MMAASLGDEGARRQPDAVARSQARFLLDSAPGPGATIGPARGRTRHLEAAMRSFAPHAITRAALILVALAATNARAQSILPLVPGANGSIRALAVSGNSLYIGGSFTQLGRYTGAGAAVDGANGALSIVSPGFVSSPDFQPGGLVFATCDDGSGGWFAGGIFSTVGGQSRKNLVHILADGSVAAWNADASAPVRALLRSGSTLYVGGDFATLGGQSRANLGAVDTGTGNVLAWNPGADGPVFAFALSGSTLYVGGQFLHLAGQARSTIGAVEDRKSTRLNSSHGYLSYS